MWLVWQLVFGSLKWRLWLIVSWMLPLSSKQQYAALQSYFSSWQNSFLDERDWGELGPARHRKMFPYLTLYPPKIHWPPTWWPRWYFHLSNLLSSIFMILPESPSFSELDIIDSNITCRKNSAHLRWLVWKVQQNVRFSALKFDSFDLTKKNL